MNADQQLKPQSFSSRISIADKSYLYFSGTAYLGLPQHQDFIHLYLEGIKKYGLNNGTSRNNNIQLAIYDQAEKEAATRFCSKDAIVTSSGYLAAQLVVRALYHTHNVLYAPGSHPALWINEQPALLAESFTAWSRKAVEFINQSPGNNWLIISNSMNNLIPEIYDFSFVSAIDKQKKIILVVDDSHGIGINNNGLGAYSSLPQRSNVEIIMVASMAKALGVDAGLILASGERIRQLKKTPVFIGASPPSAAGLHAFVHAGQIYQEELKKLQQNISFLAKRLNHHWKYEEGFPAFLTHNPQLGQALLKLNILISSFPYPKIDSPTIHRVVLSSWHSRADIEQLISAIHTLPDIH